MNRKYETRILLLLYHLFWAAPGINGSLHAAFTRAPIPIGWLILGIPSLLASLGFLFKFTNKILLYTLSLLLNIFYLIILVRTQIMDPGLLGYPGWLMAIFTAILLIIIIKIILKSTLSMNESAVNK